jgi:hypothetical protein
VTERIELQAMRLAQAHFEAEGFEVRNVARVKGHGGYDLLVSRGEAMQKVEVKGCSREWQIPDLYSTEFDADRRLVADILCVVWLIPGREGPTICLVPRDAIPPEYVEPKAGFRINSRFKKKEMLERFCVGGRSTTAGGGD